MAAMVACTQQPTDYTSYVDPMIGTAANGHTFPGATLPNGMIQASPDTRVHGWDASSGYHYSDTVLNGFTQTHLSGTGCADYGDFLIMPVVGAPRIDPQNNAISTRPWASVFSHDTEFATPGYYAVQLESYDIKAEVSVTDRAAIYRFTYPEHQTPGMIVDLDYSIQNQRNIDMKIEFEGDTAIRAYKLSSHWAPEQQLAMYAVFSKPFTASMVQDTVTDSNGSTYERCKALLEFAPTSENEQILVKLGISAVDTDGAKKNLLAEIPDMDFDAVSEAASKRWNDRLSTIEVQSDDIDELRTFYTALYHTAISPNLFTDVDGRYLGMDHKIHAADPEHPVYTVFSLWDTFRALHPLLTITNPDLNNDFIRSLISKYEEGGILPMWELAANYTGCMTGYHAVSLMADATTKGIADFDARKAFEAAARSSIGDTTGIHAAPFMRTALMQPSKKFKNTLGFIPWNEENESVAKGLEYAYDDWCISLLAAAAGDTAAARQFEEMGQYYHNYFDKDTRFMRGKDAEGNWHEPFHPRASNHRSDDYCEGTAWQWTWFVPHDVDGLVDLMGGREAFVSKLDSLFTADSGIVGEGGSSDISGMIGQYAHGNEPSHHIVHLYNYVGEPHKTQELVDQILREQYHANPEGLSGNEDCGQMSAWYVLNALGFYQVCPGIPVYSIGRPIFPHAKVNLPNGKTLEIKVKNQSPANKHIKSMRLNGRELEKPFFTHADILDGAVFEFEME